MNDRTKHSTTWGRPAPQVQLEIQFSGCRACKN